jgi:GNAT superfamily N-acetyltransferase
MDAKTVKPPLDEVQKDSYKIIGCYGKNLPSQYKNMIFSRWLRSLRHGNDYFKLIDSDTYYDTYHRYIELVLARKNTIVSIAVLSDDEDVALGFSIQEGVALHYIHVHKDNRKQGIATALVSKKIEVITHLTKTGLVVWNLKLPNAIFDPFY